MNVGNTGRALLVTGAGVVTALVGSGCASSRAYSENQNEIYDQIARGELTLEDWANSYADSLEDDLKDGEATISLGAIDIQYLRHRAFHFPGSFEWEDNVAAIKFSQAESQGFTDIFNDCITLLDASGNVIQEAEGFGVNSDFSLRELIRSKTDIVKGLSMNRNYDAEDTRFVIEEMYEVFDAERKTEAMKNTLRDELRAQDNMLYGDDFKEALIERCMSEHGVYADWGPDSWRQFGFRNEDEAREVLDDTANVEFKYDPRGHLDDFEARYTRRDGSVETRRISSLAVEHVLDYMAEPENFGNPEEN